MKTLSGTMEEINNMLDHKFGHYVKQYDGYLNQTRNIFWSFMLIKENFVPNRDMGKLKPDL